MGVLVVIVIIAVAIGVPLYKQMKRAKLKQAYDEALRGTDKQRALFAGRQYYASCRKGGILTTYDETAINNDLSSMKVN